MDTAFGIAVTSFLVGLSGAMMPGPVLTVTVGETAVRLRGGGSVPDRGRLVRGALAGPLVVLGHGALEVCLVIAVVLGLGMRLRQNLVVGGIGILTSLSNPYWAVWWATIGLGYIALSLKLGAVGLVAFYCGHILSDLVWYGAISLSLVLGHRLLTDRAYRGMVAACAGFLLAFGLYFGYAGARALAA